MQKVELAKIQNKVYTTWQSIESDKNLRKHKLSLSDYEILSLCLKELFKNGKSETCILNVAEWCKNQGLKVVSNNVNFTISFD